MALPKPRSGIWPSIILTALVAASCGDDSDSNEPAAGGTSAGTDAGGGGTSAGTASGGAAGDDASGAGGESDGAGAGGDAGAVGAGGSPPIFETSTKLDLLFVIDNSLSMGDKQALFAASIPALVERLVDPWCVSGQEAVPPNADGSCPPDMVREYPAVRDLHVGVITSSLGSMGGQVCSSGAMINDQAHLVGVARPGLTTWNDSGFLKWDPMGMAEPPGASDPQAFAAAMAEMVVAAGDEGCGYEMPLEAMYRFLVDPEPPLTFSVVNNLLVPSGIDEDLLAQRAAFIRPDSAIMVVLLSDENDCSIIDRGQGWLTGFTTNPGGAVFTMPRATQACATDPNSPCCRSCATNEASPPDGCTPLASDVECLNGDYTSSEDSLNLRCFDQKRRFGFDLLQPLDRYVNGLTLPQVRNRAGNLVPNPLFAGGRHPNMVMLTVIAGVPWQDVAVDPSPSGDLAYLSTEALTALNRWDVIVGDLEEHVAPTDPFMIESPLPRSGSNPITGDPIVDETSTDPTATINGHEAVTNGNDLQYACIFPLVTPMDCSSSPTECDCTPNDLSRNRPLCQPPTGGEATTTQYYGKAYPGLRLLDVARRLDTRSAVASICPRNSLDPEASDYGYYAALRALQARLAPRLLQ